MMVPPVPRCPRDAQEPLSLQRVFPAAVVEAEKGWKGSWDFPRAPDVCRALLVHLRRMWKGGDWRKGLCP